MKPKLSVVIPTCHRNDDLAKCLDRLGPGQQSLTLEHYEVIVTDDGRDSTAESMIEDRYPWARWTQGPRRGPAANRNHGALLAVSDWLVFTDDDCLPERQWLEEYSKFKDSSYAVLEGKTLADRPRQRLDEEAPINETGGLLWSCNFAILRSVFYELNGFEESFPYAAMEDIEFRTRVQLANHKVLFVAKSLVLHPWRIASDPQKWDRQFASVTRMIELHPTFKSHYTRRRVVARLFQQAMLLLSKVAFRNRFRGASYVYRNALFTLRLLTLP